MCRLAVNLVVFVQHNSDYFFCIWKNSWIMQGYGCVEQAEIMTLKLNLKEFNFLQFFLSTLPGGTVADCFFLCV